MPLDKPNLQPTLFEIEELVDEGRDDRTREEQAREMLIASFTGQAEPPAWMDSYLMLREQGWGFRKAAYIAWAATPKEKRWPDTQEELATKVLGLTTDRVISTWRRKNPALEEAIAQLQTAELYRHRGAVLNALVASASDPDYKHHPDRKMYLEMVGDYIPISQLRAMLLSGKLSTGRRLEDMDEEDLMRLAGGDWSVLAENNEEAEE